MDNKDILEAMWNYLDKRNNLKYDGALVNWLDAEGWAYALKIDISAKRLGIMYTEGLLQRNQNKRIYGNTKYHYFPDVRPTHLED